MIIGSSCSELPGSRLSLYYKLVFATVIFSTFGATEVLTFKMSYFCYAASLLVVAYSRPSWFALLGFCVVAIGFLISTLVSGPGYRSEVLPYHLYFFLLAGGIYSCRLVFTLDQMRSLTVALLIGLISLTFVQIMHPFFGPIAKIFHFPTIDFYDVQLPGAGFINPNNNAYFIFFAWALLNFIDVKRDRVRISLIDLVVFLCLVIAASRYFIVVFLINALLKVFHEKNLSAALVTSAVVFLSYENVVTVFDTANLSVYTTAKYSTFMDSELSETLAARFYYLGLFSDMAWFPFGLFLHHSAWSAPHALVFEFSFLYGAFGFLAVMLPTIYFCMVALKGLADGGRVLTGVLLASVFFGWFIPSTVSVTALHYLLCVIFSVVAKMRVKHALLH